MRLNEKEAQGIPGDVLDIINGVVKTSEIWGPALKEAYDAISSFIQSLGAKNPNSPKNVRIRLAALEVKDELNKQKFKEYDAKFLKLGV